MDERWPELRESAVSSSRAGATGLHLPPGIRSTWACRSRVGGAVLRWPDDKAEDKGLTVWHIAEKESQWFSPSDATFIINYRVDDLGELIAKLRADGVEIIGGPESHENGKFAMDHGPGGKQSGAVGVEIWNDSTADSVPLGRNSAG